MNLNCRAARIKSQTSFNNFDTKCKEKPYKPCKQFLATEIIFCCSYIKRGEKKRLKVCEEHIAAVCMKSQ